MGTANTGALRWEQAWCVEEKRAGHSGSVVSAGTIIEGEAKELGHPAHVRNLNPPPFFFFFIKAKERSLDFNIAVNEVGAIGETGPFFFLSPSCVLSK